MSIEYRTQIVNLARQKGPLLPADVARLLKTDFLRAGAMLSEMSENKILIISALKVGGSPLYYLPEQTQMLERYTAKLNEKDRRVFETLKQKQVLKDSEQDVLTRFALRQLRDFAKPMHLSKKAGEAELYWRIYSIDEEQAIDALNPKPAPVSAPAPTPTRTKQSAPAIPSASPATSHAAEKPAPQKKSAAEKKTSRRYSVDEDELYLKIKEYCAQKKLELSETIILSKNKDIEFTAKDAKTTYFGKAKAKKSFSDTDIAAVFGQAAAKGRPAILLLAGALTKKAQAASASFPSMVIEIVG